MSKTGLMLAELGGWALMLLTIFAPVWLFLTAAGMLGMCS